MVMPMRLNLLNMAFAILLLASCSQESTIEQDVERLYKTCVTFQPNKLLKICNTNDTICDIKRNHPYSMILYIDSTECTPCWLKSSTKWNDLFYLEQQGKIEFIFIFQPQKFRINQIRREYLYSGLRHSIYLDTCGTFISQNKNIPENNLLHCFLIDDKDSVLLVGDPTRHSKLKQMMLDVIDNSN